ncbi:MAG: hypothetical protein ABI556_14940, partial [Gemmatimonadales bacterium]
MFVLRLLGTLSLQCETGTVPPEALQKRRLGLIALLAIEGERGISRDRLQSYLWPESSSSKSRHALDQLIYATRRSLGTDPFVSAGGELGLDPAMIHTDIETFDSAFRGKNWAVAVAAYGGSLVDGFHFSASRELESLIDRERNRLEQQYHKALETLAHDAAAAGDHVGSTAWWKKLAASDRLSARVALETVKALDAAGDRVGAIQHA